MTNSPWQEPINRLVWQETNIQPTSEQYTQSKTRCKWSKNDSNPIDIHSQLTREHKKISNLMRAKTTKPKPKIQAHKYRIYPNKETKATYNKAFGTLRFIYNKALDLTEYWSSLSDEQKLAELTNLSIKIKENYAPTKLPPASFLRAHLIRKDALFLKTHPWLSEYLYDFKDLAIRQLRNDYKTAYAKQKVDNKPFKIHKKTRRAELLSCSFFIYSKYWYTSGFWSQFVPPNYECRDKRCLKYLKNPDPEVQKLIDLGYYPNEPNKLPKKIQHAAKIQRQRNKYYIVINARPLALKESKENLLVVDPGYRTSFTCINFADNVLEEIGMNMNRISSELDLASQAQSKSTDKRKRKRTRRHLKRRQQKHISRAKNLIDDLHRSTSKYMCENFSTILIPKLNFHGLANLNKKSKALAQRLSHCSFVDRLKAKSSQYKNCKVIEVSEECTSKTCSLCGAYDTELGSKKTYRCKSCGMEMDRDMNAVYNILMKNICLKAKELGRKLCF